MVFGVLVPEPQVPAGSSKDLLLASFERYLLGKRALAEDDRARVFDARARFLDDDALVRLSAGEVTGAVVRRADSGLSVAAAE